LTVASSAPRAGSDKPFVAALVAMASMYLLLILAMIGADIAFAAFKIGWTPTHEWIYEVEDGGKVEVQQEDKILETWIQGRDFVDASELAEQLNASSWPEKVVVGGNRIVLSSEPELDLIVGDTPAKFEWKQSEILQILTDDGLRSSIILTLFSCTVTAILSILFAVPTGYLLSRYNFRGKTLVDAILDIPIVLPPLVIGLSLLILFNQMPTKEHSLEKGLNFLGIEVTYQVSAVILAQFSVACAFAVRTMRTTFDQISPRTEQVAQTLGCSRGRAFFTIVIPESWRGISTAGTLAWTRAMGEFGPILVFAGTMEGRTEVLSSTVFLEITAGNLEGAVIVSILMVTIAMLVLIAVRSWDRGNQKGLYNG
jgi:molybdate transport system permease protein